ncbi:MAG: response regulator [Lentisphaeria bacterium]
MLVTEPNRNQDVLIVDDEDVLREFYTRVFANFGYNTICAGDGSEAITMLEEDPERYTLVILDMNMPIKNGWEVLDHMRNHEKLTDKPVIAITGLSMDEDELKRLSELCDGVIPKGDFEMTRLGKVVSRVLGTDLTVD